MKDILYSRVRSAGVVIQNIALAPVINTDSPYFLMIRKCSLSQKARLNTFRFLVLREGNMR